ncbi:MAG: HD domain-containing protein [Candidatus Moraniibacteriota bacterium]
MITKKDIEKIEKIAREYFIGASGCHDWSHIERVRKLALRIGKAEKADLKIVESAVLFHDIGRKYEMNHKGEKNGKKICHAIEGKKEARKILENFPEITPMEKENILHSIEAHRHRNSLAPETLEAKVLFDADKLDSIGAIGIGRIFLFAGSASAKILYTGKEKEHAKDGFKYSYSDKDTAPLEYEVKLKHIKNKMLTKTGKFMARERDKFMREFFDVFWQEVEGGR